jgi:hypothetical protein
MMLRRTIPLGFGTRARGQIVLGVIGALTYAGCRSDPSATHANGAAAQTPAVPAGNLSRDSGVSGAIGAAGNAGANSGVPPEVSQSLMEWPLPGRDYNNSRYTHDSPITSVLGLQTARWTTEKSILERDTAQACTMGRR